MPVRSVQGYRSLYRILYPRGDLRHLNHVTSSSPSNLSPPNVEIFYHHRVKRFLIVVPLISDATEGERMRGRGRVREKGCDSKRESARVIERVREVERG